MFGPTEGAVRTILVLSVIGACAVVAACGAGAAWLIWTLLKGMGVLPL